MFVCPQCAARFGEARFELRGNYEEFVAFAQTRVRTFNADASQRTCPKCGHVHPPTYGFHAEADTAEERTARNGE